jgi:hypothetical protein
MAVSHKVANSRHLLKLEPSKAFGLIAFAKLVAPNSPINIIRFLIVR